MVEIISQIDPRKGNNNNLLINMKTMLILSHKPFLVVFKISAIWPLPSFR
jgi:hypothetical protein